jgi:hypothetical protein
MISVLSMVELQRVYPRCARRKRLVLLITGLVLVTAGCGGGGSEPKPTTQALSGQRVAGDGYVFQAPEDWTAKVTPRAATVSRDADTLVSVTVLPLLSAYRPSLFPRVTDELDRVAKELAGKLGGELTSAKTIVAAGRKAREYRIEHGELVDRITFVLKAKREYQLTCRWRKAGGEPDACGQLAGSFSLS